MALNTFARISLREVAREYLAEFGPRDGNKKYDMYICPVHEDTDASYAVYDDHYHCYGCDRHGEHIQMLVDAGAITASEWADQFEAAKALLLNGQRVYQRTLRAVKKKEPLKPAVPLKIVRAANRQIDMARPYLESRGLWPALFEAYLGWLTRPVKIKHGSSEGWIRAPYITIPHLWNAHVYNAAWGIKLRRDDAHFLPYCSTELYDTYPVLFEELAAKKDLPMPQRGQDMPLWEILANDVVPRYKSIEGSRFGIYMAHMLEQPLPMIAVVEGEFDCMLLIKHGVPAVALKPGHEEFNKKLPYLFSNVGMVYIIADNDSSGIEKALQTQGALGRGTVIYPPHGKDVTDSFLWGYTEWILSLAREAV